MRLSPVLWFTGPLRVGIDWEGIWHVCVADEISISHFVKKGGIARDNGFYGQAVLPLKNRILLDTAYKPVSVSAGEGYSERGGSGDG